MKGEVCCCCGAAPVLYYSNGCVFCKAHKAEATRLAAVGLKAWTSQHRADGYENIGGTLYTPPAGHGSSALISKFKKTRKGRR